MSLQLELPEAFYDELRGQLKDVYAEAMSEAKRDFGFAKEYLTINEAIDLVSVSRNTFTTNFIKQGLQLYVIGNKQYVKKSELNEFIAKHAI